LQQPLSQSANYKDSKAFMISDEALSKMLVVCTEQCRAVASFFTANHPKLQAMLRRTLQSLGLPPHKFGTHSLRIGAATAAASAGIPMDLIKSMGRWSSECYCGYL